jgi:hypothetical protein
MAAVDAHIERENHWKALERLDIIEGIPCRRAGD